MCTTFVTFIRGRNDNDFYSESIKGIKKKAVCLSENKSIISNHSTNQITNKTMTLGKETFRNAQYNQMIHEGN